MNLMIREQSTPPGGWDERMASVGSEAGLLQSSFWGELMLSLGLGKPLYLEILKKDVVVGQLLLICKSLNTGGGIKNSVVRLVGLSDKRIEFSDGPVFIEKEFAQASLNALLGWIAAYARDNRIGLVRSNGFPANANWMANGTFSDAFVGFGYDLHHWATYLVDLSLEEDALFMSLEHAARKGIKKAAREGIFVKRVEVWDEYLDLFLEPYMSWSGAQGDRKPSNSVAKKIWDHSGHSDFYRYYVAIHPDGTPLAVLGMYMFGGVATEITSGLSPEAIKRKIPAQDLLHWEIFLEAKREGCHIFDLAGVSPEPATTKEENIRRFKKKWGGRFVQYERYEWSHWTIKIIRHLVRLKDRLKSISQNS